MINIIINHQTFDILPELNQLDNENLTRLLSHGDREAFHDLLVDHSSGLADLLIQPQTTFQYDSKTLLTYARERQVTPRPLLSPGPHHGAHLGLHNEVAIIEQALTHGWPDQKATNLNPETDPEAFSDALQEALDYLNGYVPRGHEFAASPSMDYGVWPEQS